MPIPDPLLQLSPVTASAVRYIKLGRGGENAAECLAANEIGLGFDDASHTACQDGRWEEVRQGFLARGAHPQKATTHTNELRAFYQGDTAALWITFADDLLWWGFAHQDVSWRGENVRHLPRRRRMIGSWRSTDLAGAPLHVRSLRRRLTIVRLYKGTICDVAEKDYLLRRINGLDEPIIQEAINARNSLQRLAIKLTQQLHETDFELLIDLIFNASGWRRVSVLGETEKDIDLLVEQIATNQRAFVQVKSRASAAVLDDYKKRYSAMHGVDRLVFVCHSPDAGLRARLGNEPDFVNLWFAETIADKAVRAGLFDWIVDRLR